VPAPPDPALADVLELPRRRGRGGAGRAGGGA
jgi:hypothetical protein